MSLDLARPASLVVLILSIFSVAQEAMPKPDSSAPGSQSNTPAILESNAEAELQQGTALTSKGAFVEAIPHLLAARGKVVNEYAADFNLALCYVATGEPELAIPLLNGLKASGHDDVKVNNLLAQAYVGGSDDQKAFQALQQAASLDPQNEKLYVFIADACTSKGNYKLGLRAVDLGLTHLPDSARLHFERAMFLSSLDQFDSAKKDFELAQSLGRDSDIAFLAAGEKAMFEGNIPEAMRSARKGTSAGHTNFMLLTLLGEALLRSGVAPGQPEFAEAQQALEKAVAERGNYPDAQLALGKLYLASDRVKDAVAHLEAARELEPGNPAVYSNLAAAYRKEGDSQKAEEALARLAKLNAVQAERIRTASGETRASYGTSGPPGQHP